MIFKVKKETEVEVVSIKVRAGVRYWEDASIDGVEDVNGDLMPCRNGDNWEPVIDIKTGQITNWQQGKAADVHYKICDDGDYYLLDKDNNIIASIEGDYVPKMLCPKDNGYGDYMIMDIDSEGFIQNWKPSLKDFKQTV